MAYLEAAAADDELEVFITPYHTCR